MTLTVPTYKVENNEVSSVDTRVYTLTAYRADDTQLDPADGPEYIEGGGVVTFKVTGVSVDGAPAELDNSNSYDKAAQENLSSSSASSLSSISPLWSLSGPSFMIKPDRKAPQEASPAPVVSTQPVS